MRGLYALAGILVLVAMLVSAVLANTCSKICINNQCQHQCIEASTTVITGKAPVVNQDVPLSEEFSAITVSGVSVLISRAERFTVRTEGYHNLIEHLDIDVISDKLTIRLQSGTYENSELLVRVELPHLTDLEFHGGHDLTLIGFNEPVLSVNLQGSVRLTAKQNRVDRLMLQAVGSSEIDWSHNQVRHLSVDLQGANTFYVNFIEYSDAVMRGEMAGLNQLFVCGKPMNELSIKGLSSVNTLAC